MPFAMGVLGAHWRGSHAPDEILELTRDGSGDIFIREKTSGETVMVLRRTGANAYTLYNNTIAGGKIVQDSSMKNAASGIAGLDATSRIAYAQAPANMCRIGSGSYAGDNTANRAVAHGLGIAPKLVIGGNSSDATQWQIINSGRLDILTDTLNATYAVTAADATNFYVGNAASYPNSQNAVGSTYYWVAFG